MCCSLCSSGELLLLASLSNVHSLTIFLAYFLLILKELDSHMGEVVDYIDASKPFIAKEVGNRGEGINGHCVHGSKNVFISIDYRRIGLSAIVLKI